MHVNNFVSCPRACRYSRRTRVVYVWEKCKVTGGTRTVFAANEQYAPCGSALHWERGASHAPHPKGQCKRRGSESGRSAPQGGWSDFFAKRVVYRLCGEGASAGGKIGLMDFISELAHKEKQEVLTSECYQHYSPQRVFLVFVL